MNLLTLDRADADVHAGMLDQLDAVRQFIAVHPSFPVTSTAVSASGDATIWKLCDSAAEVDRIAEQVLTGALAALPAELHGPRQQLAALLERIKS